MTRDWLVFLHKSKRDKIGTKAKRLKEIIEKTDFLVPKTLVLTFDFYIFLIKYNRVKNPFLFNWQNFKIPDKHKDEIFKEINKEFGNKPLVIRSSASCEDSPLLSFAGQYSTFLNIKSREDILKAINFCYASLFSPNAMIYANFYNINLIKEKMAIMIQEVIPVEISGVIFTVNPVTHNKDFIVIEYTKGLGDKVVSGEIEPKFFKICKNNFKKEKDNFKFIIKETVFKIEKIFKLPQDIEWGLYGKNFYIFQSRPITSLKNKPIEFQMKDKLSLIGKGEPACYGKAEGNLVVIRHSNDYLKIKDGDIILNKKEPKFSRKIIYYMSKINGIITTGGILSHVAVNAREFNKPCLVEPLYFNEKKYENKKIFIDAFKGKIFSLK